MQTMLNRKSDPDETLPVNNPDLLLETGVPDDVRQRLTPVHAMYGIFWAAWRSQDEWPLDVHAAFWDSAFPLWPCSSGRPSRRTELAFAYRAAISRGLTREQAAEAIAYKLDSLRRMGAIGDAELLTEHDFFTDSGFYTDYVLPRIYTSDESLPDPMAYPNALPAEKHDPRTAEIQRRFARG